MEYEPDLIISEAGKDQPRGQDLMNREGGKRPGAQRALRCLLLGRILIRSGGLKLER